MNRGIRQKDFIIYICFFLSGAAGLAYEVLWTRILSISFGHTVYAVTTVLAAFMGGLALGSLLIGRLADRMRSPLLVYGFMELAIGLTCLAVPLLLSLVRKIYLYFYPSLMLTTGLKVAIQFGLAASVIIIPAALMGGTLPILVRGLTRDSGETGLKVSHLYGINTVGAACGAFAAGYLLLPVLGNRGTNLVGVALNLAVGVIMILFAIKVPDYHRELSSIPGKSTITDASGTGIVGHSTLDWILLFGIGLSGAIAMSYQIVWTRALVLVIGTSTYAFSSILVTFLLGLGLGSYLFPRIKAGATVKTFAILQLLIGGSAFILIPVFHYLPRLFLALFKGYEGSYLTIQLIQFIIVSTVVLLPTIFLGMTLPCVAGILAQRLATVGRDVGRCYAYNTAGAIAGSVLTGFILIPFLGVQKTLALGIGANILLAAVLMSQFLPKRQLLFYPSGIAVVAILLLLPGWERLDMVSGVSIYPRTYLANDGEQPASPQHERWELLYYREGISSNVAVTKSPSGVRTLWSNGRAEAGTTPRDMESFTKLAYLPLVLHDSPKRVAIIGLGGGITAYVASLFDSVQNVDVIELDPTMPQAAEIFSSGEFDALSDERFRLIVDDGRSFIEGVRDRYDVIICAPSQVWVAGVASLFTTDFFRMAKAKLAPGGIICLWTQGYNLSRNDLKMMIRTFQRIFPNAILWEGDENDYILMGFKGLPEAQDLQSIQQRVDDNPGLSDFLATQGEAPRESLLASFRLNSPELLTFVSNGPVNLDDMNQLEFSAPKAIYTDYSSDLESDLLSVKSSTLPQQITSSFYEAAAGHLNLGRYLLQRNRSVQARWQFNQVTPLYQEPKDANPRSSSQWTERIAEVVTETFDGEETIPFYPFVDGFLPEQGEGADWDKRDAYHSLFRRISGVVPRAGATGTSALVINSLDKPMPLAFVFPIPVEPNTDYRVGFWLKNEASRGTDVGAGYLEFDNFIEPDKLKLATTSDHFIKGIIAVSERTRVPWTPYSFPFRTSEQTRMVLIQLYRFGEYSPGATAFDDLFIEKVTEEH